MDKMLENFEDLLKDIRSSVSKLKCFKGIISSPTEQLRSIYKSINELNNRFLMFVRSLGEQHKHEGIHTFLTDSFDIFSVNSKYYSCEVSEVSLATLNKIDFNLNKIDFNLNKIDFKVCVNHIITPTMINFINTVLDTKYQHVDVSETIHDDYLPGDVIYVLKSRGNEFVMYKVEIQSIRMKELEYFQFATSSKLNPTEIALRIEEQSQIELNERKQRNERQSFKLFE